MVDILEEAYEEVVERSMLVVRMNIVKQVEVLHHYSLTKRSAHNTGSVPDRYLTTKIARK